MTLNEKHILLLFILSIIFFNCSSNRIESLSSKDIGENSKVDIFLMDISISDFMSDHISKQDSIDEELKDIEETGGEDINESVEDIMEDTQCITDIVVNDPLYCNDDVGISNKLILKENKRYSFVNLHISGYAVSKDGNILVVSGVTLPPDYYGYLAFIKRNGELLKEELFEYPTSIPVIDDNENVYVLQLNGYISRYSLYGEWIESIKVTDIKPSRCYPLVNPPATIGNDGTVYANFVCGTDDNIFILASIKDGKMVWIKDLVAEGGSTAYVCDIILGLGDVIYLSLPNINENGDKVEIYSYIMAINGKDGSIKWKVKIPDSVCKIQVDNDDNLYFVASKNGNNGYIYGRLIKMKDGNVLWERNLITNKYAGFDIAEFPDNTIVILTSSYNKEDTKIYKFNKCGKLLMEKKIFDFNIAGGTETIPIILSDNTFIFRIRDNENYSIIKVDNELNIIDELKMETMLFQLTMNGCGDLWFWGGKDEVFNFTLENLSLGKVPCPVWRCDAQNTGRLRK